MTEAIVTSRSSRPGFRDKTESKMTGLTHVTPFVISLNTMTFIS